MGKIAFLFVGQGAQYPGMGRDLYDAEPASRAVFDLAEARRPGTIAQCFSGDRETLSQTDNTQPCLFADSLACAAALTAHGVQADFAAGFSLGEITAMGYTGILSEEDAFSLVCTRGAEMHRCALAHPGSMAAVLKLQPEQVSALCGEFSDLYPVNYNCPGQISVAGSSDEMDAFLQRVKEAGGRGVKLAVSGAFHTRYMAPAGEKLQQALATMTVSPARIPLYANYTARPYPAERGEIVALCVAQLQNCVRFEETLRNLYADGADTFIEVGAGTTLSGFVNRTLTGVQVMHVSDVESLRQTLSQLGKD